MKLKNGLTYLFLLLIITVQSCCAQKYIDSDHVTAKQSLTVAGRTITEITNDSTFQSANHSQLATSKAAKNYADSLFANVPVPDLNIPSIFNPIDTITQSTRIDVQNATDGALGFSFGEVGVATPYMAYTNNDNVLRFTTPVMFQTFTTTFNANATFNKNATFVLTGSNSFGINDIRSGASKIGATYLSELPEVKNNDLSLIYTKAVKEMISDSSDVLRALVGTGGIDFNNIADSTANEVPLNADLISQANAGNGAAAKYDFYKVKAFNKTMTIDMPTNDNQLNSSNFAQENDVVIFNGSPSNNSNHAIYLGNSTTYQSTGNLSRQILFIFDLQNDNEVFIYDGFNAVGSPTLLLTVNPSNYKGLIITPVNSENKFLFTPIPLTQDLSNYLQSINVDGDVFNGDGESSELTIDTTTVIATKSDLTQFQYLFGDGLYFDPNPVTNPNRIVLGGGDYTNVNYINSTGNGLFQINNSGGTGSLDVDFHSDYWFTRTIANGNRVQTSTQNGNLNISIGDGSVLRKSLEFQGGDLSGTNITLTDNGNGLGMLYGSDLPNVKTNDLSLIYTKAVKELISDSLATVSGGTTYTFGNGFNENSGTVTLGDNTLTSKIEFEGTTTSAGIRVAMGTGSTANIFDVTGTGLIKLWNTSTGRYYERFDNNIYYQGAGASNSGHTSLLKHWRYTTGTNATVKFYDTGDGNGVEYAQELLNVKNNDLSFIYTKAVKELISDSLATVSGGGSGGNFLATDVTTKQTVISPVDFGSLSYNAGVNGVDINDNRLIWMDGVNKAPQYSGKLVIDLASSFKDTDFLEPFTVGGNSTTYISDTGGTFEIVAGNANTDFFLDAGVYDIIALVDEGAFGFSGGAYFVLDYDYTGSTTSMNGGWSDDWNVTPIAQQAAPIKVTGSVTSDSIVTGVLSVTGGLNVDVSTGITYGATAMAATPTDSTLVAKKYVSDNYDTLQQRVVNNWTNFNSTRRYVTSPNRDIVVLKRDGDSINDEHYVWIDTDDAGWQDGDKVTFIAYHTLGNEEHGFVFENAVGEILAYDGSDPTTTLSGSDRLYNTLVNNNIKVFTAIKLGANWIVKTE